MNKIKLEKYLAKLQGSQGSYPFGPDALVFKVMDKIFALVAQKETVPKVTLKCAPADGEILVGEYDSISPGYYMNKKHWITITLNGGVPEELIMELVAGSYRLVTAKLTKAEKKALSER